MGNCKTEIAGPVEVAMMGMIGYNADIHDCTRAIEYLARMIDKLQGHDPRLPEDKGKGDDRE